LARSVSPDAKNFGPRAEKNCMRAFFFPQTGNRHDALVSQEQSLQTLKPRGEVKINARKEKGQEKSSQEKVTP